MTKPFSSAPSPDTSNANVARALHIGYLACRAMDGNVGGNWQADADRLRALADALDAQAATPWEKRVERLARHLESTSVRIHWGEDCEARNRTEYNQRAEAALRIAAPELAPGDD